jgi:tetratricopeptide (TPR) repeat protein
LVFENWEYGKFINQHFISLHVNGEKGRGLEYKQHFKIQGYPTVVLLNKEGNELDRLYGWQDNKIEYFESIVDIAEGRNTFPELKERLTQSPRDVELNYRMAKKHISRGERDLAMPYFSNVLKLDSLNTYGHNEESRGFLAVFHLWETGEDQPLQLLLTGTKHREYLEKGYNELIRYHKRHNNQEPYLDACEKMLQIFPERIDVMSNCAWYIYKNRIMEKYDWGISLAEDALALKPEAYYIWDTLAWLEYEKGFVEQAIDHMKRAVELAPDKVRYEENLRKMQRDG